MEKHTYRKEYIDKLLSYKDKGLIKVISGLRRSGKSTLLEIYREKLIKLGIGKSQIQFYNFELPENFVNKSWDTIYFDIKKKLKINKPNYVFLDEVQNIPFFEKLIDGLFASENVDVYVTGSNAFLLSGELAAYFGLSVPVFSVAWVPLKR